MVTSQLRAGPDVVTGSASLREFGIIYFGNDWFAENRTSSHHVAERLSERTRVLYVDSPGLRAPKANARDLRKLGHKLLSIMQQPRLVGDRLWHVSVPQIPFRRVPFVRSLNVVVGKILVKHALQRLRFTRTLSWFAVPHPGSLANAFDETAVVYYCIDDYAALPGVDAATIAELDANLTRRADLVFVASARMLQEKRQFKASTVLAPHGVDAALFRSTSDPLLPIAPGTRHLRRPIVGFFGLIEEWIDLDLIAELAERRPGWTFLLIGRLAVDARRAKSLRNIVFAGPQPYRSLPSWAKAFDVAIIPYRLTRQVVNSAPLKIREYLATGKPVVAVPAPEIERFAGLVRIASGPEQFISQIEDALVNDTDADRARRIEATAAMTWEARVSTVVGIVERTIWQKQQSNQ